MRVRKKKKKGAGLAAGPREHTSSAQKVKWISNRNCRAVWKTVGKP